MTAKEGKLKGFELVKMVHLDDQQFAIEVRNNDRPRHNSTTPPLPFRLRCGVRGPQEDAPNRRICPDCFDPDHHPAL